MGLPHTKQALDTRMSQDSDAASSWLAMVGTGCHLQIHILCMVLAVLLGDDMLEDLLVYLCQLGIQAQCCFAQRI